MKPLQPKRILHVVGAMNVGGVETWLMNVLKYMDQERLVMDFLVHKRAPGAYDEEIRRRGSRIMPCLHPQRPVAYARRFFAVLKQHGPYDVLHSHVHHFSGLTLTLARLLGIPVRIAHSHMDSRYLEKTSGGLRRTYCKVMQELIFASATSFLATSRAAGEALFGSKWKQDERSQVFFGGLDLKRFGCNTNVRAVRRALGLPEERFVLGHVGAFREGKNQSLLLDIGVEMLKRREDFHLLLVGEGPARPAMEARAARLGVRDKVLFTGARSDVPELMKGAMDVFIMPSCYEGLGMVCVEAQAAGLPVIISDRIPQEAVIISGLVERVSLSEPAAVWAERILQAKGNKLPQGQGGELMEKTPFNILENIRRLEKVYGCHRP